MRCQSVDGSSLLLLLELVVEDVEVVEGVLLVVICEPVIGLAELLFESRVNLVVQKTCFAFSAKLWAFTE